MVRDVAPRRREPDVLRGVVDLPDEHVREREHEHPVAQVAAQGVAGRRSDVTRGVERGKLWVSRALADNQEVRVAG